jgi:hypothetical protein
MKNTTTKKVVVKGTNKKGKMAPGCSPVYNNN